MKKKPENKISLDLIDEFRNKENTKYLIKIHYPYPSEKIKIIENHSGLSAKELFEKSKDEDGLVTIDGFVNYADVSKNYVEPDKIEIKLHNITELAKYGNFNKLSYKEKDCLLGVVYCIINRLAKNDEHKKALEKMPVDQLILILNKNIFIVPEENIVILSFIDDPSKDEIKAVTKNANNEYQLEDLKFGGKEIASNNEPGDKNLDNKNKEEEKEDKGPSLIKRPSSYYKNRKTAKGCFSLLKLT